MDTISRLWDVVPHTGTIPRTVTISMVLAIPARPLADTNGALIPSHPPLPWPASWVYGDAATDNEEGRKY